MPFEFSRYNRFVVALLAFLQFTIVLDFMVLSPLGAVLMPALQISASQFGWLVSAYAFSAGLSGLLAAGFADRFDRKKLLLVFYWGFILGTLLCGLASTYAWLLAARVVTGFFAGVMGSILFAIAADLFPLEVRGRVMGVIQAASAASQVLGIPVGLLLASHGGWQVTFLAIAALGAVIGVIIWLFLRPIDTHVATQSPDKPLNHVLKTLANPNHRQGLGAVTLLTLGGFMFTPFASAFSVHNLGINMRVLPTVYLATGLFSLVIGPLIGQASDSFGKFRVFFFGTGVTLVMAWIYTHLGTTPLAMVIVVYCLLFLGLTARMIPAQALLSAIPQPAQRGAYMSLTAAVQQFAGGVAASLAGYIVVEAPDGKIERFALLGYVLIVTSLMSLYLMWRIHRKLENNPTQISLKPHSHS